LKLPNLINTNKGITIKPAPPPPPPPKDEQYKDDLSYIPL
jgi:hypothetical protein